MLDLSEISGVKVACNRARLESDPLRVVTTENYLPVADDFMSEKRWRIAKIDQIYSTTCDSSQIGGKAIERCRFGGGCKKDSNVDVAELSRSSAGN
jgi:hypothetical protein